MLFRSPEQCAEGEQREQHGDRMQTDALADQSWREPVALEHLPDTEYDGNGQRSLSRVKL